MIQARRALALSRRFRPVSLWRLTLASPLCGSSLWKLAVEARCGSSLWKLHSLWKLTLASPPPSPRPSPAGDLIDQLPTECARKGIPLPPMYSAFADLKVIFALTCPDHRGTSLKQMLEYLQLSQQGRQHSGLDDCRNFARILSRLLAMGADTSPTHNTSVGQRRGHGAERRPGDWDCTACGAIAFASKATCYRCGKPRPDAPGGAAADGSTNVRRR